MGTRIAWVMKCVPARAALDSATRGTPQIPQRGIRYCENTRIADPAQIAVLRLLRVFPSILYQKGAQRTSLTLVTRRYNRGCAPVLVTSHVSRSRWRSRIKRPRAIMPCAAPWPRARRSPLRLPRSRRRLARTRARSRARASRGAGGARARSVASAGARERARAPGGA